MFFARPGETRQEAEARTEREWLVEQPAPNLPPVQADEGPYATLVRRLNDENGHVVYSGDAEVAGKVLNALSDTPDRISLSSWLFHACEPIAAAVALAIVLRALRRDPVATQRRFEEAGLALGVEAIRVGMVLR